MTEKEWIKHGYSMGVVEPEIENHVTFFEMYSAWFDVKVRTIKPESVDRIECTFNRHFLSDVYVLECVVSKMDEIFLIDWLTKHIMSYGKISKREFDRIYAIFHGVLLFAYDMGDCGCKLLDWDKIRRYMPHNNIIQDTHTDTCIPLKDINTLFYSVLVEKSYQCKYSACLCLLLNFYLGLRVGELAALSWSDVDINNRIVNISKTEVKYFERCCNGNKLEGMRYRVVEHTKTQKSMRTVPLCDGAIYILTELRAWHDKCKYESPYLAYDGGGTVLSRSLSRVLTKLCSINGLPHYSTHKIRKTYASFLHSSGVPIKVISDLCGHTEISTTAKYYIRNMNNNNETITMLNTAFSGMVDLKQK